jgi:hypothetical protein
LVPVFDNWCGLAVMSLLALVPLSLLILPMP